MVEERRKAKNKNFSLDYQIYLINFFLMRKFMSKACKNSQSLKLKNKNGKIYSLIKN